GGVLPHGPTPPRGPGFYGALSQTCKQKSRIRAPPDLHGCAGQLPGSPLAAGRPGLPGVEGQLQVVHAPQLVVHLQQGLDDGPDLRRHTVDLLVGDPLQLTLELLVEIEKSSKPPDCRKAAVDLLIGRKYALEYVTYSVGRTGDGGMHYLARGTAHSCNSGATKVAETCTNSVRK